MITFCDGTQDIVIRSSELCLDDNKREGVYKFHYDSITNSSTYSGEMCAATWPERKDIALIEDIENHITEEELKKQCMVMIY